MMRHRGLTIVELLLSLSITGVVGAAVASMLFTSAQGTASQRDLRTLVVSHGAIGDRVAAAVRTSRMVLARGDDWLVLWVSDTTGSDQPNLSELRVLEWNQDAQTVTCFKPSFPDGWSETQINAADTTWELTVDWRTVTNSLKNPGAGEAGLAAEVWSNVVADWQMTLDADDPQDARLVSYRLTLSNGTLQDVGIGAAALRSETE